MKTFFMSIFCLALNTLSADEGLSMPPQRTFWQVFTMLCLAAILFYFVIFRPEQTRRKEVEKQRSKMKPGDRVTAVGIIGTIAKIEEDTVILRMYDGSKIQVLKAAISEVVPAAED